MKTLRQEIIAVPAALSLILVAKLGWCLPSGVKWEMPCYDRLVNVGGVEYSVDEILSIDHARPNYWIELMEKKGQMVELTNESHVKGATARRLGLDILRAQRVKVDGLEATNMTKNMPMGKVFRGLIYSFYGAYQWLRGAGSITWDARAGADRISEDEPKPLNLNGKPAQTEHEAQIADFDYESPDLEGTNIKPIDPTRRTNFYLEWLGHKPDLPEKLVGPNVVIGFLSLLTGATVEEFMANGVGILKAFDMGGLVGPGGILEPYVNGNGLSGFLPLEISNVALSAAAHTTSVLAAAGTMAVILDIKMGKDGLRNSSKAFRAVLHFPSGLLFARNETILNGPCGIEKTLQRHPEIKRFPVLIGALHSFDLIHRMEDQGWKKVALPKPEEYLGYDKLSDDEQRAVLLGVAEQRDQIRFFTKVENGRQKTIAVFIRMDHLARDPKSGIKLDKDPLHEALLPMFETEMTTDFKPLVPILSNLVGLNAQTYLDVGARSLNRGIFGKFRSRAAVYEDGIAKGLAESTPEDEKGQPDIKTQLGDLKASVAKNFKAGLDYLKSHASDPRILTLLRGKKEGTITPEQALVIAEDMAVTEEEMSGVQNPTAKENKIDLTQGHQRNMPVEIANHALLAAYATYLKLGHKAAGHAFITTLAFLVTLGYGPIHPDWSQMLPIWKAFAVGEGAKHYFLMGTYFNYRFPKGAKAMKYLWPLQYIEGQGNKATITRNFDEAMDQNPNGGSAMITVSRLDSYGVEQMLEEDGWQQVNARDFMPRLQSSGQIVLPSDESSSSSN